jgi:23S rRNA-/tRNA-specific pseudouridylate synthase
VGLQAKTEFTVIGEFADGTSLVECRPVTGRTNQIRLHLSHLGWPIVGDQTYNARAGTVKQSLALDDAPMCLHAWRLALEHPDTAARITFEADRPAWSVTDS